jgi:hypothetical protein
MVRSLTSGLPRQFRLMNEDVFELRIAVERMAALTGLAVALQAVIELPQQIGHHVAADAMAHCLQCLGETCAGCGWSKAADLRVASRRQRHRLLQGGQPCRISRPAGEER